MTFKIFNKVKVNGSNADPFYKFLKNKIPGVAGTKQIKWNFTKFLINKNGEVKERFSPQSEVSEIEPEIIKLL